MGARYHFVSSLHQGIHMSDDLTIDDEERSKLQEILLIRCESACVETKTLEYLDGGTYLSIGFQNGREKRWFPFHNIDEMKNVIDIEFERYVFIGDFYAIANYSTNYIEALFRPIERARRNAYRSIFGKLKKKENIEPIEPIILEKDYQGSKVIIELGEATKIIQSLTRGPLSKHDPMSIKISGINISQHNKSLEILRKLSDSIFFQIEIQSGTTLKLLKNPRKSNRLIYPLTREPPKRLDLEFPKIELDEGPSSLYWYARSSLGMPLLQFLAFYQVIEYYFPVYSKEEVRRRVRTILKDPTFRADRDGDIGKILSIISGHGKGFSDEKSMLRATINACLDASDLRSFIIEDEERSNFFSAKQKNLTDHKLPINNDDADLRSPVADLIYDIRCKIVHTKGENSGGGVDLLLPFSKEAELLFYDIELMQYVARKVLIAASAPLSI